MSEAGPKSLHLFGVRVAYRSPLKTTKLTSILPPPNEMVALPLAAVAGEVVRSPVSVVRDSPGTLPLTVSTRCALLTFLVTSVDCLTNVVASGSGPPLDVDPEHPATRVTARLRAART